MLVPTLYTMVERRKERLRPTPEGGGSRPELKVYDKDELAPARQ